MKRQEPHLAAGLSPRVRGNLAEPSDAGRLDGSIPACAGEPVIPFGHQDLFEVYPRVCGGTARDHRDHVVVQGLSPRVRGNLDQAQCQRGNRRSIPACAGEPPSTDSYPVRDKVYPRVCGGTF